MCDFKPGDELECVGVPPEYAHLTPRGIGQLKIGAIYRAEAVSLMCGIAVVRLVGFHNLPSVNGFYAACQFRKVQRRDLTEWLATENTIEGPVRAPVKAVSK